MDLVFFIVLNYSGLVNWYSGEGIYFNVTFLLLLNDDDFHWHDSANDH